MTMATTMGLKLKGQGVLVVAGNRGVYQDSFRALTRESFMKLMKDFADEIYEEGDIDDEAII